MSRRLRELNILKELWTFPKGALNVPLLRPSRGIWTLEYSAFHARAPCWSECLLALHTPYLLPPSPSLPVALGAASALFFVPTSGCWLARLSLAYGWLS